MTHLTATMTALMLVLVLGACGTRASDTLTAEDLVENPSLDPSEFSTTIDNPFFPLRTSSRWKYEVTTAEGSVDLLDVEVVEETRFVAGIEAVVVRVTLTVDGSVEEETFSWYAQDGEGNVWLLGEVDHGYADGALEETTTWEAGVGAAHPGIVMHADPVMDHVYRLGYVAGEMEERGKVVTTGTSPSTVVGDYGATRVIENWSDLEPEVIERKHYVEGVGFVFQNSDAADADTIRLVSHVP